MTVLALAALDQNIVATALPRIVAEFGGLAQLSWVTTAFMVASITTAPLYGRLSDAYGRRPIFFVSISVFLLGSTLCGLAQSMAELIGFRAIQGLGAGGLLTLAQTAISDVVSPQERGRYQGLFSAVFAGASVAGPLVGGVITGWASWRWIFYVNLPVGVAALTIIAIAISPKAATSRTIDVAGAATLAGMLGSALLLVSGGGSVFAWVSAPAIGLGAVALVAAALLWRAERRAADPVLPMRLFETRVAAFTLVTIALAGMGLFTAAVYLPFYFQTVLGYDPTTAGVLIAPMMGGVLIASTLSGSIVARTGRYKTLVVAGLASATASFVALALNASASGTVVTSELLLVTLGLGIGVTFPNLTTALQNHVRRSDLGTATGMAAFCRSTGGLLGVAMAGRIVAAALPSKLLQASHLQACPSCAPALIGTFAAGALVMGLATVLARLAPDEPL